MKQERNSNRQTSSIIIHIESPEAIKWILSIILLLILSGITSLANAGTATLTWIAPTTNTDGTLLTDLAGYKVYHGIAPGAYNTIINVGNVTQNTVNSLAENTTYYFVVTAYDTLGNESSYSNEVSKTIKDVIPPIISTINSGNITSNSVVITWTTDEASSSQIEYGTTTSYGSLTTINSTLVTSHSVTINGLSAWTTYHFRVKNRDAAGNLATSSDLTFTTIETTPPTGTISINSGASYAKSAAVTLTLSCSDLVSGCSKMRFSNNGTTWSVWENYAAIKSWTLASGDGEKTTYVKYSDKAGNISTIYYDKINLDTTAPSMTGITTGNITDTTAYISWITTEGATTQVEYGETTGYGRSTTIDNSFITSHNVVLTGLIPNTVYYFRVLSNDQAGNQEVSTGYSFTTLNAPPLQIQDLRIQAGSATFNSVMLEWTATGADGLAGTASLYDLRMSGQKIIEDGLIPASGEINFSNATPLSGLPAPNASGIPEYAQVNNLDTNTAYYFAIKAIDDKGAGSFISNVINADNYPPLPVAALRNGYTAISLPLTPSNTDVQTLFGGIVGTPVEIYRWSPNGVGYKNGTFPLEKNIVPGYGYIIKSSADTAVLNVSGTAITDPSRTIPLQTGWNLIGNPYPQEVVLTNTYIRRVDTAELKSYGDAVIAGWTGNLVYYYTGGANGPQNIPVSILQIWKGYWISVLQNGQYELIIYKP